MKTRQKCNPANSVAIGNKKKERKKRDVDRIKVAISLNELIETGSSSILRLNYEDFKTLAKHFKVSQQIIKSKIAELQPKVALEKM